MLRLLLVCALTTVWGANFEVWGNGVLIPEGEAMPTRIDNTLFGAEERVDGKIVFKRFCASDRSEDIWLSDTNEVLMDNSHRFQTFQLKAPSDLEGENARIFPSAPFAVFRDAVPDQEYGVTDVTETGVQANDFYMMQPLTNEKFFEVNEVDNYQQYLDEHVDDEHQVNKAGWTDGKWELAAGEELDFQLVFRVREKGFFWAGVTVETAHTYGEATDETTDYLGYTFGVAARTYAPDIEVVSIDDLDEAAVQLDFGIIDEPRTKTIVVANVEACPTRISSIDVEDNSRDGAAARTGYGFSVNVVSDVNFPAVITNDDGNWLTVEVIFTPDLEGIGNDVEGSYNGTIIVTPEYGESYSLNLVAQVPAAPTTSPTSAPTSLSPTTSEPTGSPTTTLPMEPQTDGTCTRTKELGRIQGMGGILIKDVGDENYWGISGTVGLPCTYIVDGFTYTLEDYTTDLSSSAGNIGYPYRVNGMELPPWPVQLLAQGSFFQWLPFESCGAGKNRVSPGRDSDTNRGKCYTNLWDKYLIDPNFMDVDTLPAYGSATELMDIKETDDYNSFTAANNYICLENPLPVAPCMCDDACTRYRDCCYDYQWTCRSSVGTNFDSAYQPAEVETFDLP